MNPDERRVIASRMAAELEAEIPEGETSWEAHNRPLNRVLRCVGHAAGQGASNVVTLEWLTRYLGWRFSVDEIRVLLGELSRRRIVRKLDVPPVRLRAQEGVNASPWTLVGFTRLPLRRQAPAKPPWAPNSPGGFAFFG